MCGADGGFDELWAAINKELSFMHLEMRRVNYVAKPGAPPVRFVGIVNRVRPPTLAGRPAGLDSGCNGRSAATAMLCTCAGAWKVETRPASA